MARLSDLPAEVHYNIFEHVPDTGRLTLAHKTLKELQTDVDKSENIDFSASSSLIGGFATGSMQMRWLVHIKKHLRDKATSIEVQVTDLNFGNLIRFIKAMRLGGSLRRFEYSMYARYPSSELHIKHTLTSGLDLQPSSLKTFLDLAAKIKKEDGIDLAIQHEVVRVEDYSALRNFLNARAHVAGDEDRDLHAVLLVEAFRTALVTISRSVVGEDQIDVEMGEAEDEVPDVEVKEEEEMGFELEEDEMMAREAGKDGGAGIVDSIELDDDGFPAPVYGYGNFQPLQPGDYGYNGAF